MEAQQKKQTVITVIAMIAIIGALIAAFILTNITTYTLEFNESEDTISLEYGVDTQLPEITAICKGNLLNRNGIEVAAKPEGEVDLTKLGSQEVTYVASFKGFTISETKTIYITDTIPPEITLVSDPNHFTSPVGQYEEEGYTAIDLCDGDISSKVIRQEANGVVTYTATDSSGNTTTVTRQIIYKDVIPPVITLTDGTDTKAQIGQDYIDPGFSAVDECDGDITSNVTVEGSVNGHVEGEYTLTYKVSDSSDNITEIKRKVRVTDISGPVLTLSGDKKMYIKIGSNYTEPGYSAVDNIDGDVTANVKVSGSVDTSKMGSNTITYTVTDSKGNVTTDSRMVFVFEKQAISATQNPGNKVIYLTFDDGPSKHTSTLLNILDKYGVKATFFVTNQFPSSQGMIGEAHRRGHTIALHTYNHKFNEVYASEAAYYTDLQKIHDIAYAQTGVVPTIVRFPGGTSNTVSRKYCPGIMSTLSGNLAYHGYFYCDWNVDSKDAAGAKTSDAVANNVINGVRKHNVSIVLQHDIYGYSVNAVEQIIYWGLENGYTFLPMSESTPMVHFSPSN